MLIQSLVWSERSEAVIIRQLGEGGGRPLLLAPPSKIVMPSILRPDSLPDHPLHLWQHPEVYGHTLHSPPPEVMSQVSAQNVVSDQVEALGVVSLAQVVQDVTALQTT